MTRELTSSERRWAFGLAFAIFLLSWTSIKICLPALPRLADVFHSTAGGLKLSVSLYLIFFACSQPVWGGVVQRIGRRRTLLLGIFVSTIGSTIAMLAFDLPTYLIGRTLEGVGMGSASPAARAILTAVFDRREIARRMGTVSGAAAMMPALALLVAAISWSG